MTAYLWYQLRYVKETVISFEIFQPVKQKMKTFGHHVPIAQKDQNGEVHFKEQFTNINQIKLKQLYIYIVVRENLYSKIIWIYMRELQCTPKQVLKCKFTVHFNNLNAETFQILTHSYIFKWKIYSQVTTATRIKHFDIMIF